MSGMARRGGLLLALLVFSWTAVEILALALFRLTEGRGPRWNEPAQVRAEAHARREAARAAPGLEALAWDVIHPYLGFVGNPLQVQLPGAEVPRRNAFGFADEASPIRRRSPDRWIAAIVGGSLAEHFGARGTPELSERLRESGVLGDREVVFVRLGQSGYKQPQQLIAVAYLLALGAEFDAVIALDGFNEVALHDAENARKAVHPSYPRNWAQRAIGLPDPAAEEQRGRVAFAERERARWAATFSGPLRFSPVAHIVWRWRDHRLRADELEARAWLADYRPNEDRYGVRGPSYFEDSSSDAMSELVALWERSSLQLHRLCDANGAWYFHFLQPNQYVSGSKPMGDAERAIAVLETHPYRPGAERGYPLLVAAGDRLREEGVRFRDLSGIYRDVEEPLYVDDCCHVNRRGHELLARAIAEAIVEALPDAR